MNKTCIFAIRQNDSMDMAVHHLEGRGYQIKRVQTAQALKEAVSAEPDAVIFCDLIIEGECITDMPRKCPEAKWIAHLSEMICWSVISELCDTYGFADVLSDPVTPAMICESILPPLSSPKAPWHQVTSATHAHFMRLRAIHHQNRFEPVPFVADFLSKDEAQRMSAPEGADIAKPDTSYEGNARIDVPQNIQSPQIYDIMAAPDSGWFSRHHFAPLWYRLTTQSKTGNLTLTRRSETCLMTFQAGAVTQCTVCDIITPAHDLNKAQTVAQCQAVFGWLEAHYAWHEIQTETPKPILLTPKENAEILQTGVMKHLSDVHILPIVQSALPYFLKLNDNSDFRGCFNNIPEAEMVINTLLHGESMAKLLSDLGDNGMLHRMIYLFLATDALDLTA